MRSGSGSTLILWPGTSHLQMPHWGLIFSQFKKKNSLTFLEWQFSRAHFTLLCPCLKPKAWPFLSLLASSWPQHWSGTSTPECHPLPSSAPSNPCKDLSFHQPSSKMPGQGTSVLPQTFPRLFENFTQLRYSCEELPWSSWGCSTCHPSTGELLPGLILIGFFVVVSFCFLTYGLPCIICPGPSQAPFRNFYSSCGPGRVRVCRTRGAESTFGRETLRGRSSCVGGGGGRMWWVGRLPKSCCGIIRRCLVLGWGGFVMWEGLCCLVEGNWEWGWLCKL